jgi:hypothetical protein
MAEYSRIAKGSFVSSGTPKVITLPFQPSVVKLTNYTAYGAFAEHGIPSAVWEVTSMGQGTAAVFLNSGATPTLITDRVLTGGISTFSAGLSLQYGPQVQIASISKASPAVVTTAAPHGYSTGDVVVFQGLFQSPTTGMPQIAGIQFQITVTGATTFTIPWNTNQSNYTALAASPAGAFVRKVLYPFLYLPGDNVISALSFGATTTVTTTTNHNYVVGQEIAFRIPTVYGSTQLNSLPNTVIPGSPIYGYVTAVTANNVFVCSINSTGYTAFNTNQPVSSVPGLQFPQVVAVGDVNTGGFPYTGGALYPSPAFPTFSGGVPTINGPAIQGAFVNNTSQGFIIGAGSASTDALSVLVGAADDILLWEAYLPDLSIP